MRLGRVALLGIDYATDFDSNEARRYAKEGNYPHAVLAEMLCDLYKDRPDESDGLFHNWDLQIGILASRFGPTREEAMELIRAECDPDYARGEIPEPPQDQQVPQQPVRNTWPASYQKWQPPLVQASQLQRTQPYQSAPAPSSGFSWSRLFSPFGSSMWT